jgi:hypothetical protein
MNIRGEMNMILQEFAKEIRKYAADIPPSIILTRWLKDILEKKPENNVERIIHTELTIIHNEEGDYTIVGSDLSGQKLLETLYRYVLSYENQKFSRWLHEKNPRDFKAD